VATHTEEDAEPLAAEAWNPVRVEILPFAHAFRAGSRIRVTVDAPGNNRAQWVFESLSDGETVEVGVGGHAASSVVLPVVTGVDVPPRYPSCTLRGQPCRPAP
jgi:predicted acyl esterase